MFGTVKSSTIHVLHNGMAGTVNQGEADSHAKKLLAYSADGVKLHDILVFYDTELALQGQRHLSCPL